MAAEELGGFNPFLMLVDGFLSFGIGAGAEVAFAIDHDEDVAHTKIGDALFEFVKILHVLGLVLEELVHEFEAEDVEVLLRELGPFHIGQLSALERAVVGPLGEGNFKERPGVLLVGSVVIGQG